MRKLIIGLLVCMLILSMSVAASHRASAKIGEINFDGWWYDDAVFHINVYSTGNANADNAHITIWIPDLQVYDVSRPFTMRDNGPDSKLVFVYFNEKPVADWYLVRFKLTSDDVRSEKWQWVWLG